MIDLLYFYNITIFKKSNINKYSIKTLNSITNKVFENILECFQKDASLRELLACKFNFL